MTTLSNELAFLNDFCDNEDRYRQAYWLKGNYSDNVWECSFADQRDLTIRFDIELHNGTSLTDSKNAELLDIFKSWLCIQSHPSITGGIPLKSIVLRHRLTKVLHLIDYLLLNGEQFGLSDHGLSLLTRNDIAGILLKVSSNRRIYESIYEWSPRLETFLKEKISTLSPADKINALLSYAFLKDDIPDHLQRDTSFNDEEIISSRIWLWINAYYRNHSDFEHKYSVKTSKLCGEMYRNTLFGWTNKSIPSELQLVPMTRYYRELEPSPVRTTHQNKANLSSLGPYYSALRSLGMLSNINLKIPSEELADMNTDWLFSLKRENVGRFKTLPAEVVITSLKKAIEFALAYGDEIVDSYICLAKHAIAEKTTCLVYSNRNCISQFIAPKLREIGVTRWSIDQSPLHLESVHKRCTKAEFFREFRKNPGLYDILRILYGCVQICVGILMARRSGELAELMSGNCIDTKGKYLFFKNRKSGIGNNREIEMRPIPPIAVKLIRQLERLQIELLEANILSNNLPLFSYPSKILNTPILKLSQKSMEHTFDFFCDYFETEIDTEGRRFYIRQHQLRRAFAMLFFWNNSFGGMDTLRWFLGHTDAEHLYNYITESIPGEVLVSIKAQFGMEQIRTNSPESMELAAVVQQHFGTSDFSVLDDLELEEYIEELILDNIVQVQPHFFKTPTGSYHRIAITASKNERIYS